MNNVSLFSGLKPEVNLPKKQNALPAKRSVQVKSPQDQLYFSGKQRQELPQEVQDAVQVVLDSCYTKTPAITAEEHINLGLRLVEMVEGTEEEKAAVREILENGKKLLDPKAFEEQFYQNVLKTIRQHEDKQYQDMSADGAIRKEHYDSVQEFREVLEQAHAENPDLNGRELLESVWHLYDEIANKYKAEDEYSREASEVLYLSHRVSDHLHWYDENVIHAKDKQNVVFTDYLWEPVRKLSEDVQEYDQEAGEWIVTEERNNPVANILLHNWGRFVAQNRINFLMDLHEASKELDELTKDYDVKIRGWDSPNFAIQYQFTRGRHEYWNPSKQDAEKLVKIFLETSDHTVRDRILPYLGKLQQFIPEITEMLNADKDRLGQIAIEGNEEKRRFDLDEDKSKELPLNLQLLLGKFNDPLVALNSIFVDYGSNDIFKEKTSYEPLDKMIEENPDPNLRLKAAWVAIGQAPAYTIPSKFNSQTMPAHISDDVFNMWTAYKSGDKKIAKRVLQSNIYSVLKTLGRNEDCVNAMKNEILDPKNSAENKIKAFDTLCSMASFYKTPTAKETLEEVKHTLFNSKSNYIFLAALSEYQSVVDRPASNEEHKDSMAGKQHVKGWDASLEEREAPYLAKYIQDLKPYAERLQTLMDKIPEDTRCSCGHDDAEPVPFLIRDENKKLPRLNLKAFTSHQIQHFKDRPYVKLRDSDFVRMYTLGKMNNALQIDYHDGLLDELFVEHEPESEDTDIDTIEHTEEVNDETSLES